MDLPIKIQIPLFLKILSYERNLIQKNIDEIRIAVLYQRKNKNSLLVKDEIEMLVNESVSNKIQKFNVNYIFINLDEIDVEQFIVKNKIDVFYVTPLRAYDIQNIKSIARTNKILTITGVVEYVEQGFSVGLELKNEKPLIVINLSSSKQENADFSSQLLKLAKIIN